MADKVELPRIAPSEYTNTSRLIYPGPCIVKTVHVASSATGGTCDVYDGVNDSGKLKVHMDIFNGFSYTWRPGEGTDFDYGIYIKVNDVTTSVTVTFIPESRKAFI